MLLSNAHVHCCAVEVMQSLVDLMRKLAAIRDSVAVVSRRADLLDAFKVSGTCARAARGLCTAVAVTCQPILWQQ